MQQNDRTLAGGDQGAYADAEALHAEALAGHIAAAGTDYGMDGATPEMIPAVTVAGSL